MLVKEITAKPFSRVGLRDLNEMGKAKLLEFQ